MSLEHRVALVTGAGRGIGRAIALRLAWDGAELVVADLDEGTLTDTAGQIVGMGRRVLFKCVDVSRKAEVEALVEDALAQLGRIDVLVNNAGVADAKHFLEVTEEDWDNILAVNVKGVFFFAQSVAAVMIRSGRPGKIINVSSLGGKRGSPMGVPYSASKAAVISITQGLALGLARHGITVNAVCPGLVHTRMVESLAGQLGVVSSRTAQEVFESWAAEVPIGRPATPEDVANVVGFLASSDSDYVTGQSINVDGGLEFH